MGKASRRSVTGRYFPVTKERDRTEATTTCVQPSATNRDLISRPLKAVSHLSEDETLLSAGSHCVMGTASRYPMDTWLQWLAHMTLSSSVGKSESCLACGRP
ncbi:hypothetical protein EYF80_027294 [Liparis tanakae]|uniref:Uncharacterized protein n=1 Tax=Liparis tanakae TaxID=230148 RepID=A0A4Z2HA54_9TELE|nr:hypothetical protein EYF80_027294 [Liparis tanakae]